MAYIAMAYTARAEIAMACITKAYPAMTYAVRPRTVVACTRCGLNSYGTCTSRVRKCWSLLVGRRPLLCLVPRPHRCLRADMAYSYGLYSSGLYSYGLRHACAQTCVQACVQACV